ncbi:fungal-specific transcription factor domain-containing protein [Dipodascopsis uninucleata]
MEIRTLLFERLLSSLILKNPEIQQEIIHLLKTSSDSLCRDMSKSVDAPYFSEMWQWYKSRAFTKFELEVENTKARLNGLNYKKSRTSLSQHREESIKASSYSFMLENTALHVSTEEHDLTEGTLSPSDGIRSCSQGSDLTKVTSLSSNRSPNSNQDSIKSSPYQSTKEKFMCEPLEFANRRIYTDHNSGIFRYIGLSSGLSIARISAYKQTLEYFGVFPYDQYSNNYNINILKPDYLNRTIPSDSGQLMDHYFATVHCWLPMVDRYKLMTLIHNQNSKSAISVLALLWAVLSISLVPKDPTRALKYAEYAEAIISAGGNNIERIQTDLILSLYYLGIGRWQQSWEKITFSCNLAIDSGFYLSEIDSVATGNGHIALKQRLRTWCACYVLDTLIAARLGKMPNLRSEDWYISSLIDETGAEEWESYNFLSNAENSKIGTEPARCFSVFNFLIRLVNIVNKILVSASVFTPETSSTKSDNELKICHTLADELDLWEDSLPIYCQTNFSSQELMAPHITNLQLVHHVARMLIQLTIMSPAVTSTERRVMYIQISTQASNLLWTSTCHMAPSPLMEYYACVCAAFFESFDSKFHDVAPQEYLQIRKIIKILKNIAKSWPGALISLSNFEELAIFYQRNKLSKNNILLEEQNLNEQKEEPLLYSLSEAESINDSAQQYYLMDDSKYAVSRLSSSLAEDYGKEFSFFSIA